MEKDNFDFSSSGWLRRYGIMTVIWSALVGGSLIWAIHQETRNTLSTAAAAARANISKDLIFRSWATSHGGVYVTPTEHTPPNPYLKLPDRDVVTTTGKKLTLMNPAYMLRELQTDFVDDYGTRSHTTSLKLLNPKNAPDDWEIGALHAFEQGEKERLEMQQIDGQPYLRMMQPLITESGCLKCHAFQGYKVGDIRGGLSTAVSMAPYLARKRELSISLALTHGAIWLIGLAGLCVSYRRDRNLLVERQKVANNLRESEQKYHMVADYTSDWEYWIGVAGEIIYMSPSCKALTGHDAEEFSADPALLLALVHPEDRAAYEAHLHAHSEHAAAGEAEFRIVRKDGETRWISHRCRPVFDQHGNWIGIRAGNRDMTERKKAEDKIAELNRNLERRVTEQTADLEAANKVLDATQQAVVAMNSLKDKIGTMADQILHLGEQSGQIGSIATLLKDLAGQINMLALNAAVEAARAGEHGKGFAVVASEIRKLADQSKKSAEQTAVLVADIQKATNSSIMVIEDGTRTVTEVTQLVQKVGELFNNLAR